MGAGPGFGGPFGGPGRGGPPSRSDLLEHHDQNKDGKLSKDELPRPMWEHLSQADSNGDGDISATELDAHFQARRVGRPESDPPKSPEAEPEKVEEKPADPPKQAEAEFAPADAISVIPAA